jgi:tetratricopeptide (TPR) repeat protein
LAIGLWVRIIACDDPFATILVGSATAHAQAEAPDQVKENGPALDPAAVRSRLIILRLDDGKDSRPVVALKRPFDAGDIPDYKQPARLDMLPREMVRQAFLIAARDELGLTTRDEVIGESQVDGKTGQKGQAEVVSYLRDNRSRELIRRIDEGKTEVLFAHETPTAPGPHLELSKLLESAERLSREEFPRVLKGLGLAGEPKAVKKVADLLDREEDQLASLGFVEVLLAVREMHRAIRAEGESAARLGVLARGYALLGVLSEFEWHPAHRAFKARALLYAQRAALRDPDSPQGLWYRAFAWALVGRHRDALVDLEAAKQKASATKAPAAPEWVELIDAFARYDSARLALKEGPYVKLAALLRMLTLSFPRSTTAGLDAAKSVVLLEPHCFRAHDAMSDFFGVSTQHISTMIGPQALEHFIFEKLPTVDELPASVKEQIKGKPVIARVAEILDQAGAPGRDKGEPSFAVLAHLLRETRFVQVARRLYFMKVMWSVPVEEFWNETHLDVADHRYLPYLETLALPARDTAEHFGQFAEKVGLIDLQTIEAGMITRLMKLDKPRIKNAWAIATAHEDETAEMALTLSITNDPYRVEIARAILAVSPFHPFARAILIEKDWEKVKDQVGQWEKENGDSPAILAALARRYTTEKKYDDAERMFSRYIALSPDVWAYQSLAAAYKAQGKIDRWQETLDEFLNKVEDPGLDHAKVRVEIANHYMELKQYDKARPYAEAAAQTWAQWAMECAARCAEAEQDWERAEAWYSRATDRYANNCWAVWYLFCQRTGQGNREAARAFVDRYISARVDRPDLLNEEYAACFYWLDGRPEQAKVEFAKAYEKRISVSAGLGLAMIADDEKNTARRDELLGELVTKHKARAPKSLAICQMLVETVLAGEGANQPLDIAALDHMIDSIPEDGRGNIDFFVGWFLKNHGDPKDARKYLERCAQSPQALMWYRHLTRDAVKKMAK